MCVCVSWVFWAIWKICMHAPIKYSRMPTSIKIRIAEIADKKINELVTHTPQQERTSERASERIKKCMYELAS